MRVDDFSIAEIGVVSLEAHFQPKVALSDRSVIVGYEALMRARSADKKIISPQTIFTRIDQKSPRQGASFRRQIALAMLRKASRAAKILKAGVAVNIDPSMLIDSVMLSDLMEWPKPDYPITLEVIEGGTRVPLNLLAEGVTTIQKAGYKVSLDDFGTAESNLLRLARLPVDEVKIDASLLDFRRGKIILPYMISAIRDLGASSCIEGIETEEDHEVAAASRADTAQGFLYGPPGPIRAA